MALRFVTSSKQGVSCAGGFGLIVTETDEFVVQTGSGPDVTAVRVSSAFCGELPASFQVMEAGLAVGSAMTALAGGVTTHEYVDAGPPGSTV